MAAEMVVMVTKMGCTRREVGEERSLVEAHLLQPATVAVYSLHRSTYIWSPIENSEMPIFPDSKLSGFGFLRSKGYGSWAIP